MTSDHLMDDSEVVVFDLLIKILLGEGGEGEESAKGKTLLAGSRGIRVHRGQFWFHQIKSMIISIAKYPFAFLFHFSLSQVSSKRSTLKLGCWCFDELSIIFLF